MLKQTLTVRKYTHDDGKILRVTNSLFPNALGLPPKLVKFKATRKRFIFVRSLLTLAGAPAALPVKFYDNIQFRGF